MRNFELILFEFYSELKRIRCIPILISKIQKCIHPSQTDYDQFTGLIFFPTASILSGKMILLSFPFLSFHVKFFPIVMIFPSPLHNLIFFSIRFDNPPPSPPTGRIRNLIQPCYCMENVHAFAVTLYLRNSFGGDASATGGESLNYSPCVPDTKKQDCGRDCWSQEDGTAREPDAIPPPRVARSKYCFKANTAQG